MRSHVHAGWVQSVKEAGDGRVKMVPRLLFEGWSLTSYQELFSSLADMRNSKLADFIKKKLHVSVSQWFGSFLSVLSGWCVLMKEYKFDGVVLEIWSQLGGRYRKCVIHKLPTCSSLYLSPFLHLSPPQSLTSFLPSSLPPSLPPSLLLPSLPPPPFSPSLLLSSLPPSLFVSAKCVILICNFYYFI